MAFSFETTAGLGRKRFFLFFGFFQLLTSLFKLSLFIVLIRVNVASSL